MDNLAAFQGLLQTDTVSNPGFNFNCPVAAFKSEQAWGEDAKTFHRLRACGAEVIRVGLYLPCTRFSRQRPKKELNHGHRRTVQPQKEKAAQTHISHPVVYIGQCHTLNPSHPLLLPLSPQLRSLCLRLYFCPANRFLCTVFLDSRYLCSQTIFVLVFLAGFTLFWTTYFSWSQLEGNGGYGDLP